MQPKPWAKSASGLKAHERFARHGLPDEWRHEMLSVQLAERIETSLGPHDRELLLHLVAAHPR